MKLLFVLAMSPLALVMADAAEQDTVNRCATIIREFQQMPEKAIPRDDDAAVASAKRRSWLCHWTVDAYADRCAEYYKKGHR